jgi:hypothetical protein
MFDQRGEAFDPVAVITVKDAVDHADFRMMNVPADHAIRAALSGLAGHCGLKVADVAYGPLDLQLQVARQAPVGQSETGAQRVETTIDLESPLVPDVAQIGQPLGALNDAIEEVAVRDPESSAVGGHMDAFGKHVDAAEVVLDIAPCELVVIAGDEYDASAFARFPQDFLNDVVMGLGPEPGAAELPAVDDVANKVEGLALGVAQEVEQRGGLAAWRAQMQIRDPDRPESEDRGIR